MISSHTHSVMVSLKCYIVSALKATYCFRRSFSTTPALLSGDTGKGVNVGRTSEMGFRRRCPGPPGPCPAGLIRGTAAERGAKNGFTSVLLPALDSAVSLKPSAVPVSTFLLPGESKGFRSWTDSFGGGTDGCDSVSRNLTKSSEKELLNTDC